MNEQIHKLEYFPGILTVEGAENSSEVINKRLVRMMRELPRLKVDYDAQRILLINQGKEQLTLDEFSSLCRDLSLKPEPFTDWNEDYFNENFEDTLEIARQRGSHDN